jgi:hypothetical protein
MNYKDKGTNTFQSGYSSYAQLFSISKSFWKLDPEKTCQAECAFLLAHHMLLRGENIRMAELSDFFTCPLQNEGLLKETLCFYMRRDLG